MRLYEIKKMLRKSRENNDHKKRRGTQLIISEVLVYRGTISEPTPCDVSIVLIFSFL